MSIHTWVRTVAIGEQLNLHGPDGADAHDAGVGEAYRAGLIRLERNGAAIWIDDFLDSAQGVDIIRIQ